MHAQLGSLAQAKNAMMAMNAKTGHMVVPRTLCVQTCTVDTSACVWPTSPGTGRSAVILTSVC